MATNPVTLPVLTPAIAMLNGIMPTITTTVTHWSGQTFVEVWARTADTNTDAVLIAELTIMAGETGLAHGCMTELHGVLSGSDCEDEDINELCTSPVREFITTEFDIDFRTFGNVGQI